jgi:hypothetical protein
MVQKIIKPLSLLTLLFLSVSCGNSTKSLANLVNQNRENNSVEKFDCGLEEGLTIEQRIKDCGNVEKHLSTGQVMKLVAMRTGQDEVLSAEFYQDAETGLIWETGINSEATSREEAQKICREKTDLNLRWRLPDANDFLRVGNKSNNQDHNLTVAEVFNSIYIDGTASFWTNSQVPFLKFFNKAVLFKNIQTRVATSEDYNLKNNVILVQCISEVKQPSFNLF